MAYTIFRITNGDIDKLIKTIAENVMRKQLTWQEEVKAKEELDRLMKEKHGSQPQGKHRSSADSADEKWSTQKTSELLNEPERTTQTDIQLARALREYPELEKEKNKSQALIKLKRINIRNNTKSTENLKGKYRVIYADPPWKYGNTMPDYFVEQADQKIRQNLPNGIQRKLLRKG